MAAGRDRNRRRRPGGKFALVFLAALAVVLATVAVVAPRLLPADRLASRAAEGLAAATGADVTVGAASFTLVGGPGLKLRSAKVSAGDAYDLALDQLDVSLALVPLLRRELVVDGVRAGGPAARASWRGLPVTLSGFALRADRLRFALPGPGSAAGAAAAPAAGGPGSRIPADLVGGFTLTAARAAWSSFTLEQVALEGDIERRLVTVTSLAARCGDGRLRAAAQLDFATDPAGNLTGDLALEAVPTGALLGAWVPDVAAQLETRLSGDARVACRLGGPDVVPEGLAAQARLTADGGLLRAGPWLGDVTPYLGDRSDLVDIRIATARLALRLADGRVAVDTLTIDGPDTAWDLGGTVGLDGRLDLAVHLRLPPGFTPKLGGTLGFFAEALRDGDRRINLDFRLAGPLADPAVTLDLAAMSRHAKRPATAGGAGAGAGPARP